MDNSLILASHTCWLISARDAIAAPFVAQFADVMRLRADGSSSREAHPLDLTTRHLFVVGDPCSAPVARNSDRTCVLRDVSCAEAQFVALLDISLALVRAAQQNGAVLLHGALAERAGLGVVLAGPGGIGKTSASNRLPPPWRSLCDDATLVVRDPTGVFWAHAWPTWSRFVSEDGRGGSWDVQHAVPLRALFFLKQGSHDASDSMDVKKAAALLVESAQQAGLGMGRGLSAADKRALHLERFETIYALAKAIPVFKLQLTRTGEFWSEIEMVI